MDKRKLYRRWKRRFLAGLKGIKTLLGECLRTGEPETVHNLRVTLRRTRLLALVGKPVLGKARVADFRQWAFQLSTALSPVRDDDVMLEWLKAHAPAPKEERLLQQHRARLWRLTRPKLLPLASTQFKPIQRWKSSAVRPGKLCERFFNQCAVARNALLKEGARFHLLDEPGLHEFRRGLRRLRYLRELALSRRQQEGDRKLERLIAFQEALGEMQNCAVVRAFFSAHSKLQSRPKVLRLAGAQERQWRERAQKHLAAFMRERERPAR